MIFSKEILYHSITTKVVAINIQASEAVIQDVFLYHSSITSEIWSFLYMIKNQCTILFLFLKKHIKESNKTNVKTNVAGSKSTKYGSSFHKSPLFF